MPSASHDLLDRAELRRLARQLAPAAVPVEDLLASEVPTDRDPGLRSAVAQFNEAVSPLRRVRVLREAIQRSGSLNYMVRHGKGGSYHVHHRGHDYYGNFQEVARQVLPFVLHLIPA